MLRLWYLKRSEQRDALAAVCTLTIKSAGEKHQSDTPLGGGRRNCAEWLKNCELEWCCPNCLVLTVGAQRKQLGLVLCVTARIRLKNSVSFKCPQVPFYTPLIFKARSSALKAYKNIPWNIRILTELTRTLANFHWTL